VVTLCVPPGGFSTRGFPGGVPKWGNIRGSARGFPRESPNGAHIKGSPEFVQQEGPPRGS
jgi:hypothetical protein